ncbi:hypothetical protein NQ314_016997 [Rhamnusium bicolor]|uniref:PiggyBac transposable element-derived protein domain-containing protein n=1 Tax=Rhamnusium bicolor TaxID=1586634 RepID=A0AAV8WTY5_9CUCU|nr:hypothetical protein NQ314_016997 [Rhamnusium bicolor]
MASWEEEQERLGRLMDEPTDSECEPDVEDDNVSFTEDNVETIEENTDSEQEFSNNELDEIAQEVEIQQRTHRVAIFEGKDGTKWYKHSIKQDHVKTRSINIVSYLFGPKGEIRHARKYLEIWQYFFTDIMLEKIVNYTNVFIRGKSYDTKQYSTYRTTDIIEVKALFGLLYISAAQKK